MVGAPRIDIAPADSRSAPATGGTTSSSFWRRLWGNLSRQPLGYGIWAVNGLGLVSVTISDPELLGCSTSQKGHFMIHVTI